MALVSDFFGKLLPFNGHMRSLRIIIIMATATWLAGCSTQLPDDVRQSYAALPGKIDYNQHVKPILRDKCFTCHGPDKNKRKAGLRLDIADAAYDELSEDPGKVAIEPGNPEGSELFARILSADPEVVMPTPASHMKLSAREKAVLVKWIEQGAVYKPHWAFVAPEKPEVPAIANKDWKINNPIDAFVLSRLESEKLKPARTATKETLLRRLSLDLTGLPPTIQELDAFLNDRSANAYEKQVDRLLASPHYGEKMATEWLDMARFADSHGYTVDRVRDMSPYRDWVIKAFNANMHYDRFITEQLAGDLMPHPTRDMIIATAFNRNHQQNTEGGIVEEEFQNEYVIDRTNTFGEAFLGLTVGCAKCHDHKYDPLSQKDYYSLYSFFNNVREAGQIAFSDAVPTPTLLLPTPEKEKVLQFMEADIAKKERAMGDAREEAKKGLEAWLKTEAYRSLSNETLPRAGLKAHYTFEGRRLNDQVPGGQAGTMKRETGSPGEAAVFVKSPQGTGMTFDGDSWLHLEGVGVYRKSDPFSIGILVNIPRNLKEGVIFHKCLSDRLYNYRGYHLYVKDGHIQLSMAHTAPSDALELISVDTVARDRWLHLTMTYDGSSKAAGLKLYADGEPVKMKVLMDQLRKEIFLEPGYFIGTKTQPPLQIGAWWRGNGFKGGQVDEITVYDRELSAFEAGVLSGRRHWSDIVGKDPAQWNAGERETIANYYQATQDKKVHAAFEDLRSARRSYTDSLDKVEELMVMQEMKEPKKSFILKRGNYDMPGEEVHPNTPAAILGFPDSLPRNRYGLARWLIDPRNPLTARVAVNRIWQTFFGVGLVKTSEDLGNQGELPSHPELLDWLATEFMDSGWDVKKLVRMIALSATYQQASEPDGPLMERDPENRLLARGPAGRMSAEMIRDHALKSAGLLNEKIGGKSVKPYQPAGLWEINSSTYFRDSGDAVYRRSLYVIIKRSVPNPTLSTFDAGARSSCIMRRQSTNTPLQALVMLNDTTFVEAARALGQEMTHGQDVHEAIRITYRKLTGLQPTQRSLDILAALQRTEEEKFRKAPAKAKGWLHSGQYPVDPALDPAAVAANTVVASTIMNSDAFLTKR